MPKAGIFPSTRRWRLIYGVEGEPEVHVGRLRRAQEGRVLHLVAAMDNLRVGAAVVVGVAGAMLRARGLAGADA